MKSVKSAPAGVALDHLRGLVASATDDQCQDWPYRRDWGGYAKVRYEGRERFTYHVAMILAGLEPPVAPLQSRHLCGRGAQGCTNWRHVRNGTPKENAADKVGHGVTNRGERHGLHKLTEADIVAIRSSSEFQRVIAERYGITQSNVSMIKSGKAWPHV